MSSSEETAVRWREILSREHGPSLALVCLGVWLHAADALLVATMMPAIVAEIGGTRLISWTVALYEIGSIVAGAASGLLALRHGLRLPMTAAACLFAVGCALSALAPEMWILLAGRLLQGFGGGGLMALSFVSVGLLFPRRLTARAMGAVSTIWAVSAFLGPLIGGLFVELASWRTGFWFFALQALVLAAWLITRKDAAAKPAEATGAARFPVFRLLWLSAGVVAIAYAGIEISTLHTPAFVLAGLICLFLFLKLDARKAESRLLPENPIGFRNRLGAALTMILCFTAATIAMSIYGPLLMTRLHGTPVIVAGYILALEAVAWATVAALLSGSPERRDPAMIVLGMLLVTASIAGFAYSVPLGPVWLIAVFAMVQGCGFGMAWTFILRRATALAPDGETQRVTGAIPTVQRLGYALGAAYVGIVANAAGIAGGITGDNGPGVADGLDFVAATIFLACLPLALLGLLAAARFVQAKA
ncbi:MFS transporter [Pelagibius litoralis]|uniref:MFS transporter n=1 Tax=Pelagibius litoralis TaxID=374515 RepID=A0A967EVG7_9PROT|nr:MFS transporter [Pelagibius litoralis]NIA68646.1 MFS transporter [Pelagibius litoralis]